MANGKESYYFKSAIKRENSRRNFWCSNMSTCDGEFYKKIAKFQVIRFSSEYRRNMILRLNQLLTENLEVSIFTSVGVFEHSEKNKELTPIRRLWECFRDRKVPREIAKIICRSFQKSIIKPREHLEYRSPFWNCQNTSKIPSQIVQDKDLKHRRANPL